MIIKTGEKFLCVSDVFMDGTNEHAYTQGKVYTSHRDGCITNNHGDNDHAWGYEAELFFDRHYQDEVFNPQPHYDNSKGSLYKVATERGWSSYIFDVVKRLERGGKKDPLRQEIEKSIDVLKIWLNEID